MIPRHDFYSVEICRSGRLILSGLKDYLMEEADYIYMGACQATSS